jgi:hypothetical protein
VNFLNLGAVPLNELTVVMGVRPVREEMVCCALVQHKPKEGSHWWKICGGTGSHSHQGLSFCERHQKSQILELRVASVLQPRRGEGRTQGQRPCAQRGEEPGEHAEVLCYNSLVQRDANTGS